MHIISLTTQGFKCFKDKIVIDLFSPKHNVIGVCLPAAPSLYSA